MVCLRLFKSRYHDYKRPPPKKKYYTSEEFFSRPARTHMLKCFELTATIVDPAQEEDDHGEDEGVGQQSYHPEQSATDVKIEKAFHA